MGPETGAEDVLNSGLSRTEDVAAAFDETNTSPLVKLEEDDSEPSAMDAVPIQTVIETDHGVESQTDGILGVLDGAGEEVEQERGLLGDEEDEGGEGGEDNAGLSDELEDEWGDGQDDIDDDWDDDDEEDDFMEEDDDDVIEDENEDDDDDEDEDEDDDDDVGLEGGVGYVNGGKEEGIVGSEENLNEVNGGGFVDEKLMEQRNVNIGTESGKQENEEKGGGNTESKVGKLTVQSDKIMDKVVRNDSDGVVAVNQVNRAKGHGKETSGEKGEGSSKKNIRRLRRRDKKRTNKPTSKLTKNGFPKRAESMGMIFMCSSETKKDCYRYKVLGLPSGKRDLVEKIYRGMRLFLYDIDLKLLYGIYKAAGRGGYNIEPKAFNSKFPSQVRFTVLEDCIPLAEEKFRKVIKENYFTKNKFDCNLNHEQVKNLCKLFIASSKGPKSKRSDRTRKPKAQPSSVRQDRSRVRGVNEGRRIAFDDSYRRHDYYHVRSREIASPLDRAYDLDPVRPLITAPRYGYDRPLERDAYRQGVLVERRDSYRQPPLTTRDPYMQHPLSPLAPWDTNRPRSLSPLVSRNAYRPLSDYHDVYRPETVLDRYDTYWQDRVPEHRDVQPTSLDVRRREDIAPPRDPYIYRRESQLYRDDPVYIAGEHDHYRPLRSEYRSRATRSLYRY